MLYQHINEKCQKTCLIVKSWFLENRLNIVNWLWYSTFFFDIFEKKKYKYHILDKLNYFLPNLVYIN